MKRLWRWFWAFCCRRAYTAGWNDGLDVAKDAVRAWKAAR